jgi:predicted DNA binding CopG/RHH family protein
MNYTQKQFKEEAKLLTSEEYMDLKDPRFEGQTVVDPITKNLKMYFSDNGKLYFTISNIKTRINMQEQYEKFVNDQIWKNICDSPHDPAFRTFMNAPFDYDHLDHQVTVRISASKIAFREYMDRVY